MLCWYDNSSNLRWKLCACSMSNWVKLICHSQRLTDIVSMNINKWIPLHGHYKAIEGDLAKLCYDMCSSFPASWTAEVVGTWKL